MIRRAAVIGFDHHVSAFCKNVNSREAGWRFRGYPNSQSGILRALFSLRSSDALIAFGGPAPHRILVEAARKLHVPIFVIWAGSDVSKAIQSPLAMSHMQRDPFVHIAIAPWLVSELSTVGISADFIRVIGVKPQEGATITRQVKRVITYLPAPRRDFYGRKHVYEVARSLPHWEFVCLGPGGKDIDAPPNIVFTGWVSNVNSFLDKSTVLLRVPEHDGMSLIVLEALSRGRYVCWNHPLPGVRLVNKPDETTQFLLSLEDKIDANQLDINRPGLEFISRDYEANKVVDSFLEYLGRKLSRTNRSSRTKRVAISGLDLFGIEIANINDNMDSCWQAEVLQFQTRYDIVRSMLVLAGSDVWYTIGSALVSPWLIRVARVFRKPRIMHWVGSDIELASKRADILKEVKATTLLHLTEVDWEVKELKSIGIESKIAPLPPRKFGEKWAALPPLPPVLTLLFYLPQSRTEFYGKRDFERLIAYFSNRNVHFLIVGGGQISVADDSSVQNLGWQFSLGEIYAKSTALVRLTSHDGLSLMVLEALTFGRHVLWTKKFDFVEYVPDFASLIESVERLLDLQESRKLAPRQDAASFVRRRYDREHCVREIIAAWDSVSKEKDHHGPTDQT